MSKIADIIDLFSTQLSSDGYEVYPYISQFFNHSTATKAAYILARQIDYSTEYESTQNSGSIQVEIITKQITYSDTDGTSNETNADLMESLEQSIQGVTLPSGNLLSCQIQSIGMGIEQESGALRADAFLSILWGQNG